MTSLKRNPSDHPVSVSQPSVAKCILRRNSSGRRDSILLGSEPLRRNSSGKGDSSSTVPRVASVFKRGISNRDTMTSNTPSVKSFPDSSQSQKTPCSSLVYKSHLLPSTNSDHTSMLENRVNTSGNINLSHKSSLDTSSEVRLSCPSEVTDEHPKAIFLESNEEIEEPATPILLESNEEIEESLKSLLLESNEEIDEPPTCNPPVASPVQLTAVSTALPVNDLPPSFTTLQPSSPPQSHPLSAPTLKKYTEEAKDLSEEPPEPSSLSHKVHFLKLHLYLFMVHFLCKIDLCCLVQSKPDQDGGTTRY